MIKLVHAQWVKDFEIALEFSDGSDGVYDFAQVLMRETALTLPLRRAGEFQRFFLELGALCWPHGLEFSGTSLRLDLLSARKLRIPQPTA